MKFDSKTFILITWGIVALATSLFALMKPLGLGVSDSAIIESFAVYKSDNELAQPQNDKVDQATQGELKDSLLYLCGYLSTDGRPARLRILIRDASSQLVHVVYKEYPPGFFCEKLTADMLVHVGNYDVVVFRTRDQIAKTTLLITK